MSSDGGLRKLFREKFPDAFWQAVEVGAVGRGVPDAHWCCAGRAGWVEYKLTETYSVPLRPEQVSWLGRYARAGGRCHVAVRHRHEGGPRRGPATDDLYLYPGAEAAQLLETGLYTLRPLLHLAGGPRRWDWAQVRAVLLSS